jgi:hypothetical protein
MKEVTHATEIRVKEELLHRNMDEAWAPEHPEMLL